ncbi:MAG TPA: cytochrome c biogenesis protein CcdA [Candidatus Acetatifactor stercoripullorum]|uniref:Cytochrome c biogenesis protein CcdA n=1 Tax=Candidatus Acetatifactor stercoripullorum TaxID=2838414 RepID=A0A9D1UBK1_9FIRM|nr:cytochrome c biogenesis protein CcdA [Candidatus Acetatifactor stercoripullorum]HIW80400.1 cytochrome c biogenesis protein CcdA [Candidatus Acetatifactor stercoripullorum]
MQYFISFLEGIITFISPCLLPMLPIYISFFAGGGERSTKKTLTGALGFVLGFTVVFVAMGALAGTVGSFLREYQTAVNIVSGLIVVFFGLHFLGVIKINLFRGNRRSVNTENMGFFSAALFGIVFSLGWTPCVGAFLGSALMLASQQGHVATGMLMLLCYSLGLGLPFLISALLIDKLKSTFDFIKRNYKIINLICGGLLIVVGISMMTGLMGRLLAFLS